MTHNWTDVWVPSPLNWLWYLSSEFLFLKKTNLVEATRKTDSVVTLPVVRHSMDPCLPAHVVGCGILPR